MAKTHSLDDWQLIVNGLPVSGFGENDAFSFEPSSDRFEMMVGADGEGVRSKLIDQSGRLTITLLQVSASNDALQAAALIDDLTGLGQFSILVKHTKSNTTIAAARAWVANRPGTEIGRTAGERQWFIDSTDWAYTVGGIVADV